MLLCTVIKDWLEREKYRLEAEIRWHQAWRSCPEKYDDATEETTCLTELRASLDKLQGVQADEAPRGHEARVVDSTLTGLQARGEIVLRLRANREDSLR
ncbi:hypothetical protein H2203_006415 [Taxawa tesnikishii (nom. ined.)]|nr:hypothetical protein H2203_006415 [Dothideales sp. JES 119]